MAKRLLNKSSLKVPEDQAIGKYTLEVRGGGEIPLPYVLEKQKYNLTDEILRRLKIHKDFNELYDEIQKTDTNNQIVVEFLEDGISLVDEDGSKSVKKLNSKMLNQNLCRGCKKENRSRRFELWQG